MSRSALEIVYRALLAGQEVEIDGRTWVADDNNKIFMKMECWRGNERVEDRYMDGFIEFNHFVDMCEKLSEDDLTIIAANSALRSFNVRA